MKNFQQKEEGAERIAKYLARAGVCSRRDAERMIDEGRVRVNGKVLTTPASFVTGQEDIVVDGKRLKPVAATRLWIYHKPKGLVTTHKDEQGRETVFDRMPKNMPRVISVGRLDLNSEGLLLLTNDGALARHLELPKTALDRTYRVRVHGTLDEEELQDLRNGITVDGVKYGSIRAVLERQTGANAWLTMTLQEGKNREIRNIMNHLGLDVNRLIRISYGPFELGTLPIGEIMEVPTGRIPKVKEK
jgi:23S rRNA pseudouridine2605 synthase